MSVKQIYPLINGVIINSTDTNIYEERIRFRGNSRRNNSSGARRDALLQSAFIISSLVSLVVVVCFCWIRWLEYRSINGNVRENQPRQGEDTLTEEEEDRLRGKILNILPRKVLIENTLNIFSRQC